MSSLDSLIKRNMKIFFRTKGNLFFASLSIIILLILHFALFRNSYTDDWIKMMENVQGVSASRENFKWLVDSLMFAAIIPIGSVTISFVALGVIVADKENNTLSDFLVAPINRISLFASYIASSMLIGASILTLLIICIGIFFFITYGITFSLVQILLIFLVMLISLLFGNALILFILSFVKSQQVLGGMGAIIGTMIGFLSGAYVPVGMFGELGSNILSSLPFLQLTVLSRQAFLYEMKDNISVNIDSLPDELTKGMGIEAWLGNSNLSMGSLVLSVVVFTLILIILLKIRFTKLHKSE